MVISAMRRTHPYPSEEGNICHAWSICRMAMPLRCVVRQVSTSPSPPSKGEYQLGCGHRHRHRCSFRALPFHGKGFYLYEAPFLCNKTPLLGEVGVGSISWPPHYRPLPRPRSVRSTCERLRQRLLPRLKVIRQRSHKSVFPFRVCF
ncbi:hypothetical protein FHS90_002390 [Rufibacter quisquiliarum]|uniref:Uncharacterized protein n=1 Tax=Rufibacter quisquiliarum TaxID=1549639 RepID=A0A839GFK2_9BACT|nr:hypothetical protein [Rufibacter quisquiliarum]